MVHAGEDIVPRGRGGVTVNVSVNGGGDAEETARQTAAAVYARMLVAFRNDKRVREGIASGQSGTLNR